MHDCMYNTFLEHVKVLFLVGEQVGLEQVLEEGINPAADPTALRASEEGEGGISSECGNER